LFKNFKFQIINYIQGPNCITIFPSCPPQYFQIHSISGQYSLAIDKTAKMCYYCAQLTRIVPSEGRNRGVFQMCDSAIIVTGGCHKGPHKADEPIPPWLEYAATEVEATPTADETKGTGALPGNETTT